AQIEQRLSAHLKAIEKYSMYTGSRDSDALERENKALRQDLLKYAALSSTIKYEFKSIPRKMMYIATSSDGKFRIYSWDTETGGTAHLYESIFQYLGKSGKAHSWSSVKLEGSACEPFYHQVFQTDAPTGRIYLADSTSTCSNSLADERISVFR